MDTKIKSETDKKFGLCGSIWVQSGYRGRFNKGKISYKTSKKMIEWLQKSWLVWAQENSEYLNYYVFFMKQKNSLILIDEIDMLMHSAALKRLIRKIHEIASKRSLQIIFTTHSLIMNELKDVVSVKYLDGSYSKTLVYNGLTALAWNDMTGDPSRPIKFFVQDDLFSSNNLICLPMYIQKNICIIFSASLLKTSRL